MLNLDAVEKKQLKKDKGKQNNEEQQIKENKIKISENKGNFKDYLSKSDLKNTERWRREIKKEEICL